jgi:hypothetical protein
MIDWQSRHSNVDNRLGWIAVGIALQNGPILQRSLGEQNDVHTMMKFRFGRSKPAAFTTTHSVQFTLVNRIARRCDLSFFSLPTSDL